jgi:putative NADH-flavin reductase
MRLLILGANGKTGTQLVDLALARDHEVTAFVRSPAKVTRRHPLLQLLPGDPHSADELAEALSRHDVVLSALGVRPPHAFRPHTVLQDCAASTVAAMTRAGVRRLVLVSAAILFPEKGLASHSSAGCSRRWARFGGGRTDRARHVTRMDNRQAATSDPHFR